jgi:hypothetical protein
MTQPAAPLTQAQAMTKIARDWEAPLFFQRLAHAGVVPENDQDAQELLKLSMVLEEQAASQQKQAGASVRSLVQKSLKRAGYDAARDELQELAHTGAQQGLAGDPELLNAFAFFAAQSAA